MIYKIQKGKPVSKGGRLHAQHALQITNNLYGLSIFSLWKSLGKVIAEDIVSCFITSSSPFCKMS